jgi:hypothetical protein
MSFTRAAPAVDAGAPAFGPLTAPPAEGCAWVISG